MHRSLGESASHHEMVLLVHAARMLLSEQPSPVDQVNKR
jgi:hypothetical protein